MVQAQCPLVEVILLSPALTMRGLTKP